MTATDPTLLDTLTDAMLKTWCERAEAGLLTDSPVHYRALAAATLKVIGNHPADGTDHQPFPHYSGEATRCIKCSSDTAYTRFRTAGAHSSQDGQTVRPSTKGERLERQCVRCDYAWDEALNPPTTIDQGPVTGEELARLLKEASTASGYTPDLSPGCAAVIAQRLLDTLLIHPRTGIQAEVQA